MAQKRMFDKAITETDNFTDMPLSTKGLYFLLGMEADDEGFSSPRRVMRIHGGNLDDLNVLIGKKLIIPFQSGVIVITDWKKNNWLDSRRIRPTEYQKEKRLLMENQGTYRLLSEGLANAKLEERRGEEKRTEEKSIASSKEEVTERTTKGDIKKYRPSFMKDKEV